MLNLKSLSEGYNPTPTPTLWVVFLLKKPHLWYDEVAIHRAKCLLVYKLARNLKRPRRPVTGLLPRTMTSFLGGSNLIRPPIGSIEYQVYTRLKHTSNICGEIITAATGATVAAWLEKWLGHSLEVSFLKDISTGYNLIPSMKDFLSKMGDSERARILTLLRTKYPHSSKFFSENPHLIEEALLQLVELVSTLPIHTEDLRGLDPQTSSRRKRR